MVTLAPPERFMQREYTFDVYETRYTENEVFGTMCGKCGFTSFARIAPQGPCPVCSAERWDSAGGCQPPYDDEHTRTYMFTGTARECAEELQRLHATQFDGGVSFSNPDVSEEVDIWSGERLEVSAHMRDNSPRCLVAADRIAGRLLFAEQAARDIARTAARR